MTSNEARIIRQMLNTVTSLSEEMGYKSTNENLQEAIKRMREANRLIGEYGYNLQEETR